jgi:hypothetical protein
LSYPAASPAAILSGRPDRADPAAGAERGGDLADYRADAAAGRVHQHRLAGPDTGPVGQ